MSGSSLRMLLRAIAILIAAAGVIDPAWTVSRPDTPKLIAVKMSATSTDAIEQGIAARLGWDIEHREAASRLPCEPDERCVVIADGTVDAEVPSDVSAPSLIALRNVDAPNVAIRSASISRTHQSAAGAAVVELTGSGVDGKETEVRIYDGASVVGSAIHKWNKETSATVNVAWLPLAAGARTVRIEAVPFDGERTTVDNHIDAGVAVGAAPAAVLVFDARPSWNSTFIRRALEDDARFTVEYRARLAPALSAGTANGRLDAATLDQSAVVIIGGPDALTASDAALLEQFVETRGGTLVLLPEQAPAGASASLFFGRWSEHLSATAESIGMLRAGEVLRLDAAPVIATVIGRSGSSPVIVAEPRGEGRVVISGAMDAWRYRQADANAFDTFWRSLIAEAAAAGAMPQVTFDRDLAAAGSRVGITVRDRRMTPAGAIEASATARCADGAATMVRLWPAGPAATFTGELPVSSAGACTIEATVGDRHAQASIAVADHPQPGVERTLSKLERQVKTSGGAVANSGDELTPAPGRAAGATRLDRKFPLHAPWWIVPFAACLSAEWWLRRREGLR